MSDRARLGVMGGCLAVTLPLYAGLAILLENVPAGRDGLVGFSLASAGLFRNFSGLADVVLTPAGFSRAMAALLAGLWLLWLAAVLMHVRMSADARRRATWLVVAGAVALLALVVVLVPPVLSADLYRQAIYGVMLARDGLNPYETPAAAMTGLDLLAYANQTQPTTIYGPAFTWLSAAAVTIAPAGPLAVALAWKIMSALAALGCVLLAAPVARAIAGDARRKDGQGDDGRHAQMLLAWNPLLIVESAGAAHVEPIMMFPALVGLLLCCRGRLERGSLALVASTFTKYLTGVLVLLVAAREVRNAPAGGRLRAGLRIVVPAVVATALLFAPFARGLGSRGGVHDLAMHGGAVFGDTSRAHHTQWLMMAGFAVLVLAATRFVALGDWPRLITTAAALLLVFVVVVTPWLFPWYLVTPMVLVAVLPRDRAGTLARVACFGLAGAIMLFYARLRALS